MAVMVGSMDLLYACETCGLVYMGAKAPMVGSGEPYKTIATGCPVCEED